jgi:hypothetical protein
MYSLNLARALDVQSIEHLEFHSLPLKLQCKLRTANISFGRIVQIQQVRERSADSKVVVQG